MLPGFKRFLYVCLQLTKMSSYSPQKNLYSFTFCAPTTSAHILQAMCVITDFFSVSGRVFKSYAVVNKQGIGLL